MTAPTADETEQLRRLLDQQAVYEVVLRYCRGVDRCDRDLVASCYHPGAVDNHGMFTGPAEEFVPYALENLATMVCTQHLITSALIDVVGDAAVSDAQCLAFHRMPSRGDGLADHWVGLRFLDWMERRDGRWAIARRTVVYEWSRVDEVEREWKMHGYARGLRSRDDPSYALLAQLHSEADGDDYRVGMPSS